MLEFKLPAIGEGVVEGEIVRWLKAPGESVAANEALVEVMTDKATVEIPAPSQGIVHELRASEGDICEVGSVIAVLSEGAGSATTSPPANANLRDRRRFLGAGRNGTTASHAGRPRPGP